MTVAEPVLPPGEPLSLPGGTAFVRHHPAPTGAPTLLLLHGLGATSDLNWFRAYPALTERFGVVAMDHRGHGRGIRSRRRFRLSDCAADAAAAVERLGLASVICVGYSMGGPVAQLLWYRHRDLVDGLVLCATSRNFRGSPYERVAFGALGGAAALARFAPASLARRGAGRLARNRNDGDPLTRWAVREMRRNDPRKMLEAAGALGSFTSHRWISDVDVPTAVVVTRYDQLVPARRQLKLAHAIPGATIHPVDGDHFVCGLAPMRFVPALVGACSTVARRAGYAV